MTLPKHPLLGREVDGRYRLDELLGEGGWGAVFRASHLRMPKSFAIKVLHRHLYANPDSVQRFAREVRTTCLAENPHVVQVIDFGSDPEVGLYTVMELLSGETLAALLARERRLEPALALNLFSQACDGLRPAHLAGIIHRDLKPSNVFLQTTETGPLVKLLDFGMAKMLQGAQDEAPLTGSAVLGTPTHMAPEQILGEAVDDKTDIYALGIILYQMLTGCLPFEGPNPLVIVNQHLHDQPPRPSQRCPEAQLPPAIDEVVLKALSKDPQHRFECACRMRDAAFAVFGLLPPASVSLTGQINHPPRPRRRFGWWAVAGAAVITLAVGLYFGLAGSLTPSGPAGASDSGLAPAALPPSGRPLTVLMRMIPEQAVFYRREVFAPFERAHGVRIAEALFDTLDEVPERLRRGSLDVVKVHLQLTELLAREHLVRPIETWLRESGHESDLRQLLADFDPLALELARTRMAVQSQLTYVPRKLQTHVAVFRRSKVDEAVRYYRDVQRALEEQLQRLLGHGLPTDYALEPDPRSWDRYDLLMLHNYWARVPHEDGRTAGRTAMCTYRDMDSVIELIDQLVTLDPLARPVLDASGPTVDLFEWLALYRELDLFHPSVWSREMNVTAADIGQRLRAGEIFWALTDSLGSSDLTAGTAAAGGSSSGLDDLGFVAMPQGVSVELDAAGQPARRGSHKTTVTAWFWAIAQSCQQPELAWQLIRHMVSRPIHAREAATFAIQPVRLDVRLDSSALGRKLAPAMVAQMQANDGLIVARAHSVADFEQLLNVFQTAWTSIVLERGYLEAGRISRARIEASLKAAVASATGARP